MIGGKEGKENGEDRRRANSLWVFLEEYRNSLKVLVCYNCTAMIIYNFIYMSVLFALDYFYKEQKLY